MKKMVHQRKYQGPSYKNIVLSQIKFGVDSLTKNKNLGRNLFNEEKQNFIVRILSSLLNNNNKPQNQQTIKNRKKNNYTKIKHHKN